MKKFFFALACASVFWSCKTGLPTTNSNLNPQSVIVSINLNEVKEDKLMVTVLPPKIRTEEVTYSIPKIVPGTYSIDDYGKYIEDFSAFDSKGKALMVTQTDVNNWTVQNAKTLAKVTYWVNDTFDTEKGNGFGNQDVFSPAGTNIDAGKNFMMNMHGFVGYFQDKKNIPYTVNILHPATLWGATSLTDHDPSTTHDLFKTTRYAELLENPILYAKPDYTTFTVDGMEILIGVYSPTGKVTAESITPEMKKMITAQKNFLGPINATQKYSILLYLSTLTATDAKGFGALEHPTATTVVFPEIMPKEELLKSMIDVVSHEFFHIVTPLSIHSKEIHDFDYNAPKMSQHLWMYEGVTEYFANLFQINQGLITEEDFLKRMSEKITNANTMNNTMPFTTLSANVLTEPYKAQYLNVYEKGALIGMCLDIIIKEKSNGKRGILNLMHQLSNEYGASKPFNDEELFDKITLLTYPEVGTFLKTHVAGATPIPYATYLEKVGITKSKTKIATDVFIKGQVPYITVNKKTKEIIIVENIELNDFYKNLDLRAGDVVMAINEQPYDIDTIYEMIMASQNWKENEPITIKIKRNGKEQILKGKVKLPYQEIESLKVTDPRKKSLKEAWLKA